MKPHKQHAGVPSCHEVECWMAYWMNHIGKYTAMNTLYKKHDKAFLQAKFGNKYTKYFLLCRDMLKDLGRDSESIQFATK